MEGYEGGDIGDFSGGDISTDMGDAGSSFDMGVPDTGDLTDTEGTEISEPVGSDEEVEDLTAPGTLTDEENDIAGDTELESEDDTDIEASLEEEGETGGEEEGEKEPDEFAEETGEDVKSDEKEGERKPVNSGYANDTYSFENKDSELQERYPEGVDFDADGYPDFSPYATETVEIDMKGNHTTDYADANAAAGLEETPEGYTWHHHQDGKTMHLVPTDLHGAVGHTGGVSTIKNQ